MSEQRKIAIQSAQVQSALNQSALDQVAATHLSSNVELRQIGELLDQNPEAARIAFGLRLRQLRLKRGLSQDNLAERTDVHSTAIARFERGAREPRLTTILRLARGLEVPPRALIEGLAWPADQGQKN
jgi:DNA-binding XRE family transcriptional regulator